MGEIETRKKVAGTRCQKKQKNSLGLVLILIAVIVILIGIITLLLIKVKGKPEEVTHKGLAQFDGQYYIDEYTGYEFDGAGKGALCLGNTTRYVFNYTINGNIVTFDFKDVSIPDMKYTYRFDGDNIIMIPENADKGYNLIKSQ